MADMGEMEMPLPDNTLPMMSGKGPFGALEMGGMFSVVKVRESLARNDYRDPGWYKHPERSVASEWTGAMPVVSRAPGATTAAESAAVTPKLKAVKPASHGGH